MCITRCILRWGLVAALALGGVTLLVGKERVAAGLAMVRGKAQAVVDRCVDDPVALRRQLEGLAGQYPDRISEVRGEIAEVDHQLAQFTRDVGIAQRVVAMTTDDLGQLKDLVARAEDSAKSTARPVSIRFGGVKFDIEQAYSEARRINTVRGTYQDRIAHDNTQINFLTQQKDRLTEILNKLETEYSTFQAQLWQLDRQIDAIERNDRLIALTEEQQATLKSYEKFGKVGSLKQVEAKLAELRAKQEAQLDFLSKQGVHADYENKAAYEMDSADANVNPFDEFEGFEEQPLQPSSDNGATDEASAKKDDKSLAFAQPIVIE
jgi:chromosome segregation ATPase